MNNNGVHQAHCIERENISPNDQMLFGPSESCYFLRSLLILFV